MKTVDALIAARDFFLNDPDAWTQAALHFQKSNGKHCFCALGGISLVTGCIGATGCQAGRVAVSCIAGPTGVAMTGECGFIFYQNIEELPRAVTDGLAARGVHVVAARNAVRYANEAARSLYGNAAVGRDGNGSIMVANDQLGYDAVIACFNLAIKNAKRRHITGDRQKTKSVQAVSL
jgi:hypothetical protein